jgi:hypothetical protein
MDKKSKIADNPSPKDMLEQINGFDGFEALYRAIPFSRKLFPKLDNIFSDFSKLKDQASILLIPDQFNEIFSQHGWIAYESMNLEVMKEAIKLYENEGIGKSRRLPGLFHSKNGLQRIQAKFAQSFSLSHVGERVGAVEIECEVTSDREDLR